MKYRRFGRTELQMPVLTCGGMRFQHLWTDCDWSEIPPENQENLERTAWRAFESGINHFETARGYGNSELQLGRVLPRMPRDEIIVQTKIAPNTREEFLKVFEKCMSNLRLDYVDLLSVHGINNLGTLEQTTCAGGALEACREIQKQGRARFIGFSTHGSTQDILAAVETGEFDYINLHWYFFNQVNWPAIEKAAALDMGVFIISPNDKGGMLYRPPQKLASLCAPLSPMAFNDLFCLRQEKVHTLSIGAARPSDFDEHLLTVQNFDEWMPHVEGIATRLHAAIDAELGEGWIDSYSHGLPQWEDTPGHINLPEVLRLWSLARALGMVEFGKMRYNLLGNGGHWFPGENASEIDEAALLAALPSYRYADRVPRILREAHELLFDAPVKRLSESD